MFKWLDIQVSNFRDPSEFLKSVGDLKLNKKKKRVIEAIVCTSLWFLWKYRNDVVHGNGKIRQSSIVESIQEYSYLWCSILICGVVIDRKNCVLVGEVGFKTP